jgi:hypothetical protein
VRYCELDSFDSGKRSVEDSCECGFHKSQGTSWGAEQLLAYKDRVCSMELVQNDLKYKFLIGRQFFWQVEIQLIFGSLRFKIVQTASVRKYIVAPVVTHIIMVIGLSRLHYNFYTRYSRSVSDSQRVIRGWWSCNFGFGASFDNV